MDGFQISNSLFDQYERAHQGVAQWQPGRGLQRRERLSRKRSNQLTKPEQFLFQDRLYRDVMAEPMTLYIEEYRKKQLPDFPQ